MAEQTQSIDFSLGNKPITPEASVMPSLQRMNVISGYIESKTKELAEDPNKELPIVELLKNETAALLKDPSFVQIILDRIEERTDMDMARKTRLMLYTMRQSALLNNNPELMWLINWMEVQFRLGSLEIRESTQFQKRNLKNIIRTQSISKEKIKPENRDQ